MAFLQKYANEMLFKKSECIKKEDKAQRRNNTNGKACISCKRHTKNEQNLWKLNITKAKQEMDIVKRISDNKQTKQIINKWRKLTFS